jgi:hypothetical protein
MTDSVGRFDVEMIMTNRVFKYTRAYEPYLFAARLPELHILHPTYVNGTKTSNRDCDNRDIRRQAFYIMLSLLACSERPDSHLCLRLARLFSHLCYHLSYKTV